MYSHHSHHGRTRCGEVWYGVWCGAVWCDIMWRGAVWRGVAWCSIGWRNIYGVVG